MYFLDKRSAYDFSFIKIVMLISLVLPVSLLGQDTTLLRDVEIVSSKKELSQLGKKREQIDSTVKEQFRFNSVAEVLGYNSPVFIKTYGPGAIATTAFRGGNAEQTAVMWNGFNLQNQMLGQVDLSLLPSVLFEQMSIEYGGSSAVWGSGAVGGSIHLDSKLPFNKGLNATLNSGGGSFGLFNTSARILYSKQRFVASTKLYMNSSQNNFQYTDSTDGRAVTRRQKNAAYEFKGFMQEFKWMLTKRQLITVAVWGSDNQRRIPAFDPSAESKSHQRDQALRTSLSWSYVQQKFKSVCRAAFFAERIRYNDSLARIYSDGRVETVMFDNENYVQWASKNVFTFGVSALSATGISDNYGSRKNISRVSLLAGNKFSFLNERLKAFTSLRLEYFSAGALPLTGNLGLEYRILKGLLASVNLAKIYRQPTLNELFWSPGGNPDLKAEEGYSYEGTLAYRRQKGRVTFLVSGSAFSRRIDNWILWVPGMGGNPSPENIQKVWSRGTESTTRLEYSKNKCRLAGQIGTGYVLSTTEASQLENSDNLGKQLIYTPRYTANAHLSAGYGPVQLVFFHQYVGYRFTAGDNSKWLAPYHVSSLKLSYKIVFTKLHLLVFTAANNLFNSSYVVVAGRPMPLRNYEFGISLQTK